MLLGHSLNVGRTLLGSHFKRVVNMFKDPIAPTQCKKDKNSRYSVVFEEKGENYGTGFNVPVGTKGKTDSSRNAIPSGVRTMDLKDVKVEV